MPLLRPSLYLVLVFGTIFFGPSPVAAESPQASSAKTAAEDAPWRALLYQAASQDRDEHIEYLLIRSFADAVGRELDVEWSSEFSTVLTRLEGDEFDFAAAGFEITEERLRRFDFSEPYFPVLAILVEPAGKESASLESLSGKSIAVMKNSANDAVLKQMEGVEPLYFPTVEECFAAVAEGRADALATDSVIYLLYMSAFPDLAPSLPLAKRSGYAIALQKDSPYTAEFDRHIRAMKRDGSLSKMLRDGFKGSSETADLWFDGLFADDVDAEAQEPEQE